MFDNMHRQRCIFDRMQIKGYTDVLFYHKMHEGFNAFDIKPEKLHDKIKMD